MSDDIRAAALAGPWRAVISSVGEGPYESFEDARHALGDLGEALISVRRAGSAAFEDRPSCCRTGNTAYEVGAYFHGVDLAISAEARYLQAKAAAAGLNAAWAAAR